MKRSIYFISLLCFKVISIGIVPMQAQVGNQYAVFNYCNDGGFNAFLNSEIDSITFSRIDSLGVEHDDVVMQEVWTPDSVFRIPIDAIDSIAFRAPIPRYSEETFFITDDLLPYIVAVSDISITFASTTPQNMLPDIGQVLVAETWEAPLEDGFAGRLIEKRQVATGVEYLCEDVKLGDIFESLVLVCKCITSEDAQAKNKNILPRRSILSKDIILPERMVEIDPIDFEFGPDQDEDCPLSFKYKPSLTVKYEFNVRKGQHAKAKVSFTMRHDFTLHGEHKVETPKKYSSQEWLCEKKRFKIPIAGLNFVRPYIQFGGFIDAKAKAEFNYDLSAFSTMTFGVDYNEEREDEEMKFISESDGGINNEKTNLSVSIDGSLATGIAIVLGADIIHKRLFNFEGHLHIGPMLKGKFELSTENIAEDANEYRLLKDTKLEVDGYLSVTGKYQFLGGKVQLAKRGTWKGATWKKEWETLVEGSLEHTWSIFEWYLLPDFEKPYVRKSTSESVFCTLYPKREILFPLKIGVEFEDYSNGKIISKDYGTYHSEIITDNGVSCEPFYMEVIEPLEENTVYKVTPTVTLWGHKMNATPSVDYGTTDKLIVYPKEVEVGKGKTVDVEIIGGSGKYEVVDVTSSIARTESLEPVNGQKKAILTIYGVEVGDAVITITDEQNRTLRTDINVHVTMTSEMGGLDDVPGTDL